jgi:pimeloyl-ACP methyl ester carboxylesterase
MNAHSKKFYIIEAFAALLLCFLLLNCTGQKQADKPDDGVITTETVSVSGDGRVYEQTEGFITPETTGVQHWYQRTGPADAPPVVLINGADTPANVWHPDFVGALLSGGFLVVQYDPRDCGRSERLPWPKGFKPRTWTPEIPPPYPLTAMEDDLVGLLDALGIEKTHLIGISMGGMIAQLMGIHNPDRVLSLTLLSTSPSNSFDQMVDPVNEEQFEHIVELMEKAGMQAALSFILGDRWIGSMAHAMQVLTGASDNGFDYELLIRESEMLGGFNFRSSHGFAISAAPSRVPDLPRITAPTLILHGAEDPWFYYSHAELLQQEINGARLIPIEGEGHASPRDIYNRFVDTVIEHMKDKRD